MCLRAYCEARIGANLSNINTFSGRGECGLTHTVGSRLGCAKSPFCNRHPASCMRSPPTPKLMGFHCPNHWFHGIAPFCRIDTGIRVRMLVMVQGDTVHWNAVWWQTLSTSGLTEYFSSTQCLVMLSPKKTTLASAAAAASVTCAWCKSSQRSAQGSSTLSRGTPCARVGHVPKTSTES